MNNKENDIRLILCNEAFYLFDETVKNNEYILGLKWPTDISSFRNKLNQLIKDYNLEEKQ